MFNVSFKLLQVFFFFLLSVALLLPQRADRNKNVKVHARVPYRKVAKISVFLLGINNKKKSENLLKVQNQLQLSEIIING